MEEPCQARSSRRLETHQGGDGANRYPGSGPTSPDLSPLVYRFSVFGDRRQPGEHYPHMSLVSCSRCERLVRIGEGCPHCGASKRLLAIGALSFGLLTAGCDAAGPEFEPAYGTGVVSEGSTGFSTSDGTSTGSTGDTDGTTGDGTTGDGTTGDGTTGEGTGSSSGSGGSSSSTSTGGSSTGGGSTGPGSTDA